MGRMEVFLNTLRLVKSNIKLTKSSIGFFNLIRIKDRIRGFPIYYPKQSSFKGGLIISFNGLVNFSPGIRFYSKKVNDARSVMSFYEFSEIENKNKQTFIKMISLYDEKFKSRKGVVDFILAALKHMKEFGVVHDLETYKKLADLMPKGPYVPGNRLQLEFLHFPREQDCILELLCQMEEHGIMPDVEMCEILVNTFGKIGFPTKKCYRMLYWMPKFSKLSPWPVPKPLPEESFALAKLAIERITSVDLQTEITVFRTEDIEDSLDKTWIISGQSPTQKKLLRRHNRGKPIIVEGGDHVWIGSERVNYFVLKSEDIPHVDVNLESKKDISDLDVRFLNPNYKEKEEQSVHEQEDGIIYAVCATGSSEKDSLLSWIRLLQQHGNPIIGDLAVLFRFRKSPDEMVPFSDAIDIHEENKKI